MAQILPWPFEGRHECLSGGLHVGVQPVGNRERAVGDALGEVISYLEFELRNNPRISDPDAFIDAVDELRAKIGF